MNSVITFKELRFVIGDELSECYVFCECLDMPLVHGWRHKTFPASTALTDILTASFDPIKWDMGAPPA